MQVPSNQQIRQALHVSYKLQVVAVAAMTKWQSALLALLKQSYLMTLKIIQDNLPDAAKKNRRNIWMTQLQELVEGAEFRANFQLILDEVLAKRTSSSKGRTVDEMLLRKEAIFRFLKRRNQSAVNMLTEMGIKDFDETYNILDLGEVVDKVSRQLSESTDTLRLLAREQAAELEQRGILVKAPYLPPIANNKRYTLVLDLDETLLHFEELDEHEHQLSIRPGADSFLTLMSLHFEVVIFTAGTEDYADWALSYLESAQPAISHRLYR